MLQHLRRPYVLQTSIAHRWRTCLLYSAFVFLFLLVFQPFGLSSLEGNLLPVTLGYGLTTFVVMALLNIAMPPLFPNFFVEEKWTIGHEFLWNILNILLIGLANLLFSSFVQQFSFNWRSLLTIEVYTLAVGVFPVGASILIKEARLKKKYESQSAVINATIKEHPYQEIKQPTQLDLPSENANETFTLTIDELLYIRSADNYVEIFYGSSQNLSRKLLRNSLKNVDAALAGYPRLFRCHKSYLVNLDKVSHVSGNAQGYKLHLPGLDVLVPVSRQYNEDIKERLAGD